MSLEASERPAPLYPKKEFRPGKYIESGVIALAAMLVAGFHRVGKIVRPAPDKFSPKS